jgi:hypothetical protein
MYEFIKAVVESKQPSTAFSEGYKVDKVCDAVMRSKNSSQWEKVD